MSPARRSSKSKISAKLHTPNKGGNKSRRKVGSNKNESGQKGRASFSVFDSLSSLGYRVGIVAMVVVLFYVVFNFAQLVNVYNGLNIVDVVGEGSNLSLSPIGETRRSLYVFEGVGATGESEISAAYLFAYDEESSELLVVYIPGWVYLTPSYQGLSDALSLSNLKYAGGLVDQDRDYEYALWEIENLTAVSIDSYVWVDASAREVWEEELAGNRLKDGNGVEYINSLFKATSLSNLTFKNEQIIKLTDGINSNKSAIEIYRDMRIFSELISKGNASTIDLSDDTTLTIEPSTDGNDRYFYNYAVVDAFISNSIGAVRGRDIEKEQTRCEVYNGSSISGLASLYTRKVENNGLKVVRSDNAPANYEKTTIYVSNRERFDHSLELIEKLLPLNPEVIEGRPDFLTTGDIVVVLGEDYQKVYDWGEPQ